MNFYVIVFCFILAGHFDGLLKMDLTVILALCGKCEGLLGAAFAGFFLGAMWFLFPELLTLCRSFISRVSTPAWIQVCHLGTCQKG